MSLKFYVVFAVCVLVVSSASVGPQKSCRATISDINKQQIDLVNRCVKELGFKSGRERAQKSGCVMVCVLKNLEMLNEEGIIDQSQVDKYLIEQWPEELQERANATMQPCLRLGPSPNFIQDEFCKGYEPLVKCVSRGFLNICKGT
ncbi:unnamed protein product [Orchesella dallaii]|uniref:Uncharacterized protein n=1 Tax=Orchesella dallaii TaxID=48710 RepID=A0ABP1RPJ2_9HEXA